MSFPYTFANQTGPIPLNELDADFAALSGTEGSGNIGFDPTLNYVAQTIGAGLEDGIINAMWFVTIEAQRQDIKTRAFTYDSTVQAQAALTFGGPGSTVYFPGGWHINGTLTRQLGQRIIGGGWQQTPGTFNIASGSELRQFSTADVPMVALNQASDAVNATGGGLENIALTNSVAGATVGTGYQGTNTRQMEFSSVFVSGFNTGIELGQNCWQATCRKLLIFDAATCLYVHDAGGEDSLYESCCFFGYRLDGSGNPTSWGVHMKNQVQKSVWNSCATSFCSIGFYMEAGDTNGDGTGTSYKVAATLTGHQFEENTTAMLIVSSSATGPNSTYFPDATLIDCRAFNSSFKPPNTGQIFANIQKCNRFVCQGLVANGYSTGFQIGSNPALIGEVHLNNTQTTWGTAEVTGALNRVFRLTAARPYCSLTSNAMTNTGGTSTPVLFKVVVSDIEGWGRSADSAIQPLRNIRMRFEAQVASASAGAGRINIAVWKNGALFKSIGEATGVAGIPALVSGAVYDTPNGTTDYYNVVIFSAANFVVDTTTSYFVAEASL